ncbi:GNAT family N-acetyltransferase [Nocardia sp. NPDC005366]|uniref:GNAT family N-acetyltransferase n=1 Tax=Nocardia sp. NPDC005366 TaxID=3156878 RepID=UPI0033A2CCE9
MDKPTRQLARGVAPPQRIELDDLVVRRWQATDIAAQLAALTESFDHLHAWMPWMAEAPSLDRQRAFLADVTANWPTSSGEFAYGIFDAEGGLLGAIGLRGPVGPATLEIGYWCHVAHSGRGVITRAAAALTEIALALPGIRRVEIRCDARNSRRAAVARRLGYRLERVEPREPQAPADSGSVMVWARDADVRADRQDGRAG